MAMAVVLIILVIGSVLFNFLTPWSFTPPVGESMTLAKKGAQLLFLHAGLHPVPGLVALVTGSNLYVP